MKRLHLLLVVALLASGCTLAPVRTPVRVRADVAHFAECVAVSMPHLSANRWNAGEVPEAVRLRGWTPLGGTAVDREAGILLCR